MEDIIFDEYDEYELQKKVEMKTSKQHHYSRGFRKCALALALAVSVSTGFSAVPGRFDNMVTVEAAKKKDNKKPVIKLQGAASLQVTQNESVKIPKTTAKDNVDGNLTKKIKVSVKCGKKSYADLAKKIQKNKAVKFTKIGKYVITYTVSDKAKNKATKKRTVTVVAKAEEGKTTEAATTQSPTTESITTQSPKAENTTTENRITTEERTTVVSTTEESTTTTESSITDYSKYDIKTVTINNNTYNITKDDKFGEEVLPYASTYSDKITLKIENDYGVMKMDNNDPALKDSQYLKYFGKIFAYDEDGKDISNKIVIFDSSVDRLYKFKNAIVDIFVEDSKGNKLKKEFEIDSYDFDDSYDVDYFGEDYKLINSNPKVYAILQKRISYINWALDEKGVLTISGWGIMKDYQREPNYTPWADEKDSIRKVVIEDGVTYVGSYAFYNCPNLTEVQFAKTIKEIGKGAFYGCFGVEDTIIPPLVIPGNIEVIASDAFMYCTELPQVVMEEGVRDIRIGAFYGCSNLEKIDFPKSISTIEYDVFTATKWKQSQIQDTDVVIVNDILLYIRANTEIPKTVTSIQGDGFAFREDLQNIEIPDNVKRIGNYVFMACSNLDSVKIPNSVTEIGEWAFSDYEKITIQCETDSYAHLYAQKHGMKTK